MLGATISNDYGIEIDIPGVTFIGYSISQLFPTLLNFMHTIQTTLYCCYTVSYMTQTWLHSTVVKRWLYDGN